MKSVESFFSQTWNKLILLWQENLLIASTPHRSRVQGQLSKTVLCLHIWPLCVNPTLLWELRFKGGRDGWRVWGGRWYSFSRGGRCPNSQQTVDNCDFYDINSHKIRVPVTIVSYKNNGFQLTHGTEWNDAEHWPAYSAHTQRIKGWWGHRMSKLPKCEPTEIIKARVPAALEMERITATLHHTISCANS